MKRHRKIDAVSLVTQLVSAGTVIAPTSVANSVEDVFAALSCLNASGTELCNTTIDLAAVMISRGYLSGVDDLNGLLTEIAGIGTDRASAGASDADVRAPENLPAPVTSQVPAVPIRQSVTRDYIICLEDGVRKKMLKRHLWTKYGMTAEQYRAKWSLPDNYPVVAPGYSKSKSDYAHQVGFGTIRERLAEARARSEMAD